MVHLDQIGLPKSIIVLFIVSVFIPYVSPIPVSAVTQPIALLFAFTYLVLYKNKSLHKNLFLTIIPLLIITVFSIGSFTELTTIRSLIGYLSLFSISSATYICFRNNIIGIHLLVRILNYVIWLWFIFGAIHFISGVDYAIFFKHKVGFEISSERGVTSLATEPSYYGTVCVFMYVFLTAINRINNLYRSLLIFQIVVFAQSSISILYLTIYYFLSFLFELDAKRRIISIFSFVVTIIIVYNIIDAFSFLRIGHLITKILDDPGRLVLVDQSLNHRFQHIYFSLLGSYENYLLPQNITNWSSYYDVKASELSHLVIWNPHSSSRIMSGYGALFYELGLFGLSIPICVYMACKNFFTSKKKIFTYTFFLNIVMFSAIPIAFPIFGFIIGFFSSNRE